MDRSASSLRLRRLAYSATLLATASGLALAGSSWEELKAAAAPRVASPSVAASHGTPRTLPLATSGWEDGLQVSPDGLDLYAFHLPGDLFSWYGYIGAHPELGICDLLGISRFRRAGSPTFGSDQTTNPFGCSEILNLDILHAHRQSLSDSFATWTLSGFARPFLAEGGPFVLPMPGNPDVVSHALFTGDGNIWMVRNTNRNLAGIDRAIRLPAPINPEAKEFVADNPALVRRGGDSLTLVFEHYTDGGQRTFMIAESPDDGTTWSAPVAMASISSSLGHIEHPMPVRDADGNWWLWFTLDFDIVRSKALAIGDWDSWAAPELVIAKGNAAALGEPSISEDGSIYFTVVLEKPGADSGDRYDIDPWVLPTRSSTGSIASPSARKATLRLAGGRAIVDFPDAGTHLETRGLDGRLISASTCQPGRPCSEPLPSSLGVVRLLEGTRLLEARIAVGS